MINKISAINFVVTGKFDKRQNTKINLNYPQYNSLSFNKSNIGLVNFKAREYYKTLEENYFQLPKGAEPDVFQKASAMNILKDNDVVVTAPTGTGKTAIALYAITKNMEDGVKTFYTTPLKALSNEKFRNFQKLYGEENVGLLTGDNKINIDAPIVVMTTEVYRNMVLSDKFNHNNTMLDNLKTVIFDELHYLGDADRGGIWEQSIILSDPKTQLLSLSATIGNNKDVANWMATTKGHPKAEIVSSKIGNLEEYKAKNNIPEHTVLIDVPQENRHVPLSFEVVPVESEGSALVNTQQKNKSNKKNKNGKENTTLSKRVPNPSLKSYERMVQRLKKENKIPAIFFVFSKRGSNIILRHLSKFGEDLNNNAEKKEISKIIKNYKEAGKYLGESLNYRALEKGYAVHNAGLLPAQKELIEELFNKKLVKVVLATETLSAGINMPARTTVITSDRTPAGELNPNKFHQMAGRAGRRGIDTQGYCICMSVTKEQGANYKKLISSPPNNLESAFKPDFSFVANYYETCKNDEIINELLDKSFYAYDNNPKMQSVKSKEMKSFFAKKRLILQKLGYMKGHDLTEKGKLLAKLNGYEQLPIIDAIYNRTLLDMTPVELAAIVGTMANVQQKFDEKPFRKNDVVPFMHQNVKVEDFIRKFNKYLKLYNNEIEKYEKDYKGVEADTNPTLHLYEWAYLNSLYPDSVENWKALYHGKLSSTIKNEGSVFKEITMTADLLKQMKSIAQEGMDFSYDKKDYQYYHQLSQNVDEALRLICQIPIEI